MTLNTIYLDNNATTKIDSRVLDTMLPYFESYYGNSSSNHGLGQFSNNNVQIARAKIASLISCDVNEIVFTSGATEAINLAIKGILEKSKKNQIITLQTEHSAVIETCRFCEDHGADVIYIPVSNEGVLDLGELKQAISDETLLVCVMFANNETGVIQPMKEIADIVHEKGAYLLCDATQAVGKVQIDVDYLGIDLMAFSAHKFHGPKGIGGLYVNKALRNKISPIIHGGDQENGMRSGTLNVPLIIGFGEAAFLAETEINLHENRIRTLRDRLESELLKIPGAFVNGSKISRLNNTLNIGFPNFDANTFIGINKNLAVSNGSACKSAVTEASYVLKAMGLSDAKAFGSLRISLSKYTTEEEVNSFVSILRSYIRNGNNLL
jgi:cysteine desulfurase